MNTIAIAIVGVLAAAVTGFFSYRIAARTARSADRKTSGSIHTSEASELWEASENLRTWMTTEITRLHTEADMLRQAQATQTGVIATLQKDRDFCASQLLEVRQQLKELREAVK